MHIALFMYRLGLKHILKGFAFYHIALADLGGACRVHAIPYGNQFFRFHIHFNRKAPTSEVHTPLTGARPPTGIPGSATA